MKCPACSLINPDNTIKCGCGYIFTTQREPLYKPFSHMGVRGFFFNSLRTYRVNWKVFLLLGAFYTIVSGGIGFVTGEVLDVASDIISSIMLVFTILTIITSIISSVMLVVMILAITMTAHRASEGVVLSIKEVFTLSLFSGFFWQYIWTGVRYFLLFFGGFILSIILFILSGELFFIRSQNILAQLLIRLIISFIPLIIWFIWITTRYALASYAVIIEGINVKQALLRITELTKGKKCSIFLHEVGFGLLFLLLISIPVALFTWLIAAALGQPFPSEISFGPGELKIEKASNYTNQEWAQVIRIFVATIWIELQIIFNMLLFKSLRIQTEKEDKNK